MKKTLFFSLLSISLLSIHVLPLYAEPTSIEVLGKTVDYEIVNGEVVAIDLDSDFVELFIEVVSVDDGSLQVTIPRSLLDSKASEEEDDIFYVLLDGLESDYYEVETTETSRTLLIPTFAGNEKIQIIGTTALEVSVPAINIPAWIKSNAKWWSDGAIGDSDFISGIQYLIQQGIMQIPETQSGTGSSQQIPVWIKSNAGWWADGQISDSDFVSGIQYLITNGIIVV